MRDRLTIFSEGGLCRFIPPTPADQIAALCHLMLEVLLDIRELLIVQVPAQELAREELQCLKRLREEAGGKA